MIANNRKEIAVQAISFDGAELYQLTCFPPKESLNESLLFINGWTLARVASGVFCKYVEKTALLYIGTDSMCGQEQYGYDLPSPVRFARRERATE